MNIKELNELARENVRIANQEVLVAVRRLTDSVQELLDIPAKEAADIAHDQEMDQLRYDVATNRMDKIQDDEFKNGEERKEVEDND